MSTINKPLFSVIIPALNEEKYLPNLLSDLARQQNKKFEVIVVDGNSEDQTSAVARAFSPRLDISVLTVKTRNISYQRNYGAREAHGDYLIFIDADSRVPASFIKNLKHEVTNDHYLIYLPHLLPLEGNYADITLFKFVNFFIETSQYTTRPMPTGAVMVFQAEYFHYLGGYTEKKYTKQFFPEDHDIILRAHNNGVRAKYMKDVHVQFSLRRIKKEGRIQSYMKYLTSAVQMTLNGDVHKKIFDYEMGGHLYSYTLDNELKNTRNNSMGDIIQHIKKIFNEIMKDET